MRTELIEFCWSQDQQEEEKSKKRGSNEIGIVNLRSALDKGVKKPIKTSVSHEKLVYLNSIGRGGIEYQLKTDKNPPFTKYTL